MSMVKRHYAIVDALSLALDWYSILFSVCRNTVGRKVDSGQMGPAFLGLGAEGGARKLLEEEGKDTETLLRTFREKLRLCMHTCKPQVGAIEFLEHLRGHLGLKVLLACDSRNDTAGIIADQDWLKGLPVLDSSDKSTWSEVPPSEETVVFSGSKEFSDRLRGFGYGSFAVSKQAQTETSTAASDEKPEGAQSSPSPPAPSAAETSSSSFPSPLKCTDHVDWETSNVGGKGPESTRTYPYLVTPLKELEPACPERKFWTKTLAFESPFSISGKVVKGFGRGSTMLGIPTANVDSPQPLPDLMPGVYYGWASLPGHFEPLGAPQKVYGMVMSVGYNPYFDNQKMTVEPYLYHEFGELFVGAPIALVVVGMIRVEAAYAEFGHLIQAIQNDCEVGLGELEKAPAEGAKEKFHAFLQSGEHE
mmetsp:Transcript_31254/g.61696  ORF Transcript_31254/g.61696 Transcript_31254/m.61696 type:complete len:419 (-) Transcript_31254:480-1736(-)